MQKTVVHVAVGVVFNPANAAQVLMAQRPAGKPYAGWWEFAGGKIEPDETPLAGLRREFMEELGIDITAATPWVVQEYDYPHNYVRLYFFRVTDFRGTPRSLENQAFHWVDAASAIANPLVQPSLPAAQPVLKWLQLPPVLRLSHASGMGADAWLQRLAQLSNIEDNEAATVVLREPSLDAAQLQHLATKALTWRDASRKKLLLSSRHLSQLDAHTVAAFDGIHYTERDLLALSETAHLSSVAPTPMHPQHTWRGASCHSRSSIELAARLGFDYAAVGHILPTPSHADRPAQAALGWAGLTALAQHTPLPIYAIGGLGTADVAQAQACGAHGVAAIRGAWL